MGAHHPVNAVPDYTGIQLQTSAMSLPVPLAWGKARGAPNLIWYGDYQTHKHTVGKGGALGKGTEYTYSASLILALCEGPIVAVTKTYVNQGYQSGYVAAGFALFTGTTPQSPWSYLSSKHPDQALGYPGIAYLASANYNLGTSESLPSFSFEVEAPLYNTAGGGTLGNGDADPAALVLDFLTNPQYGVGFPADRIDLTSLNALSGL